MINNASRTAAANTRARLTKRLSEKQEISSTKPKASPESERSSLKDILKPFCKTYSSDTLSKMCIAATRLASDKAHNRMKTKSGQEHNDSQVSHIGDANSRSGRRLIRKALREVDEFFRLLDGSGLAERHLEQHPLIPLQNLTNSALYSNTTKFQDLENIIRERDQYVLLLRNSGLGDRFLMKYRMIRPLFGISNIPDFDDQASQVSENITRVIKEVNRINRSEVRVRKRLEQQEASLMKKAQKHYVPTLYLPWFVSIQTQPKSQHNCVPSDNPAVYKITTWVRIRYHWYKAKVDTSQKSKIHPELCSPTLELSRNPGYHFQAHDNVLFASVHLPKPSGKADLNMQIAPVGRCPELPNTQMEINPEVFDDPLNDSEDPEYPVILVKDVFMEEPVQVCFCYKHIAKSYGDCTVGRLHLLIGDPVRVEVELPDKARAEDECMFLSQKRAWMDRCLYPGPPGGCWW